ncbi:MAG: rhodanese-like domain-containing protein [Rhodomicrobium sp.]
MFKHISPEEVRHAWRSRTELALLDVREEGPYALAHPFFAVSLPVSEIESRIGSLVPRLSAPIAVYDDGEGFAERAVRRLDRLGYSHAALLDGGLSAYKEAGEVFRDVNVPSKAFGELVEAIRHTPSLTAREAAALIETNPDMAVADARRFEEYSTMSIPKGISVPGAELLLRIFDIAPSPDTFVLVNCAGRTRSIVGAQTLINAGIPNRVAALRNGTIGWTLEGLPLDKGQTKRFPEVSALGRERARAAARKWAGRVGVRTLDAQEFERWTVERERRTLYLLDVRTPEEYEKGHPEGFVSAPGGQLVQAADEWAGIRGARLALYDDDGVRALMTASWLAQMGWEAAVVAGGVLSAASTETPPQRRAPAWNAGSAFIEAKEVAAARAGFAVADLARSPAYRAGHIPGAWFVSAVRLAEDVARLPGSGPIVLTSPDGDLALDNFQEAQAGTQRAVRVLRGGTRAWHACGLPLEGGVEHWASEPVDVYKRPYEGTDNPHKAMQAYIDWELQLVAQLANDGVSNFRVRT